jgi:ornithine cyclodeaminase/alanine dehydrogenase-like protein (mu-crystallin family)
MLLSRSMIARLASSGDYLAAMRTAFADLAQNSCEVFPVGHIKARSGTFHTKAAARSGQRSFVALKIKGNFPGNPAVHGLSTIQGFIALLDAERGCVLALMDSIEITACRTAATTALAALYLARPTSRTLGIIGCGVQARYHLDALLGVLPFDSVRYCDPRAEACTAFARYASAAGVMATRAADTSAAALGADMVVTLTTSKEPVLELATIAPGSFVAGVGADDPSKHELAPALLAASRVVVDHLGQSSTMGDLHHAIRSGTMTAGDSHGELADLVVGRLVGRVDDRQRFVFDSTGVPIQDLAAAEMIYERACSSTDVPTFEFDAATTV